MQLKVSKLDIYAKNDPQNLLAYHKSRYPVHFLDVEYEAEIELDGKITTLRVHNCLSFEDAYRKTKRSEPHGTVRKITNVEDQSLQFIIINQRFRDEGPRTKDLRSKNCRN